MIYPIARLPDRWIEQARQEGAHVDLSLKSPWQLFAAFDGNTAFGFIGLLLVSETKATIRGWYVFPEHRNQGHGTDLLAHATEWAIAHGYTTIEIRTAHDPTHLGFNWTGYERQHGNKERCYRLDACALPLAFTA